jgi:hypothetical protein
MLKCLFAISLVLEYSNFSSVQSLFASPFGTFKLHMSVIMNIRMAEFNKKQNIGHEWQKEPKTIRTSWVNVGEREEVQSGEMIFRGHGKDRHGSASLIGQERLPQSSRSQSLIWSILGTLTISKDRLRQIGFCR